MASKIDIVMQAFGTWGSGGFAGPDALDNAKKFVADNCVIDGTASMKNTDGYKIYNGPQGMVDWCAYLSCYDFREFTPTPIDGPGNTVIVKVTYYQTVKAIGRESPHSSDLQEWTVENGKITNVKFYWGNPALVDTLHV
eukprot:TRINITY_DN107110_c0_g1_i1.p1 TRINITY_DN107110_c0_g1~~TRINITY_DN107110_c0_g1_i1.p1  ORF type:complete len:139 (+),score=19.15 TRINITY_DN107110_c0_g1_i1:63-479(+)